MSSSSQSSVVPHIHLLCMHEKFTDAFKTAASELELPQHVQVTHHNTHLKDLGSSVKFDCVVSPANSYGLLDGGFDDAISRAFSPFDKYYALTRHVQRELYKQHRGFAPPGTCTLIPIPEEYTKQSRVGDRWGCRWLALCPTMRMPCSAEWDREVVYECVWSLLCAIGRYNQSVRDSGDAEKRGSEITSILMTPLATGVGKVSPLKWANQTVLALQHYVKAVENAAQYSSLKWDRVDEISTEVEKTHTM